MNALKTLLILSAILVGLASCTDPIAPVSPQWETQMNIPIASQNYTLNDLMNLNSNLSTSERQDILQSKMVILTNRPISNTFKLEYTNENKKLTDYILSGELVMQTDNRLPSEIKLIAKFLDKDANVLLIPTSNADATALIPARSTNNQIASPQRVITKIALSGDDLYKIFSSEYLRYDLILTTPNGSSVQFNPDDYVDIRTSASINVNSKIVTK